jgi:hypothetical protein
VTQQDLSEMFGRALVGLAVSAEINEYDARMEPEKIYSDEFWESVRRRLEGMIRDLDSKEKP